MLCHVRNSAGVSKLSSLSSPCRAIGSLRKQARRRFTCCSPLHKPRENANYKYDPRVFRVSEEVEEAVQSRRPVVALETTIYTHGFPYPDNVALAALLESVVRKNGGVPATIGVLNGVARVGLSPEELIELASSDGKTELMKVSRRDLPYITGLGLTGRKINGGTTIAGTMVLAHMAGIEVFGTGGLGGVHRGGEHTMDVSADLTELGRTGVTVISSGCKSFLDIPRTLEYLETQGAFVGTFADGRSGKIDFPAFWTRESGLKSPTVIQNEKEAAAIIYARRQLDLNSGLLFANPIPSHWSIPKADMDGAIEAAVREAAEKGFHGHANTPFILSRIKELTGGKSIPANRALVESNVGIATRVAVELAKLKLGGEKHSFMPALSDSKSNEILKIENISPNFQPVKQEVSVVVAGSIAVDLSCDYKPFDASSEISPVPHTSNPAVISQSIGGVGNNVATAAHLVSPSSSVRLCSLIADDLAGNLILSNLQRRGQDTAGIKILPSDHTNRTAQYVAVNNANKDLHIAMADMQIIAQPQPDFSRTWKPLLEAAKPKWLVIDSNWHESAIRQWLGAAKSAGAKVAYEPVSAAKSQRLFYPLSSTMGKDARAPLGVFPSHNVDLATPNQHELAAMHSAAAKNLYLERQDWWTAIDSLGISSAGARDRFIALTNKKLVEEGIPQRSIQILPFIPTIITKLGAQGLLVTRLLGADHPDLREPDIAKYILSRCNNGNAEIGGVYMRLYPASEVMKQGEIVSVNGVGDTFLGVLVAGLARGARLDEELIGIAQRAAVLTLKSGESVSPRLRELKGELEGLVE